MTVARLERLRAALAQAGLEAVALNPGATLTYLSGLRFHLMERPLVLLVAVHRNPALILPVLEMPKVSLFPYTVSAFPYGENPSEWAAAFGQAVRALELDGRRIGVEPRQMRLLEFQFLRAAAPQAGFPDASGVLASLRVCKDPSEVEAMRRAVHVAQAAFEAAFPLIQIGMSEKDLAAELTLQLLRHGCEPEMPFSPIVASGANSANPHALPSERKIRRGDLLLVDWGATVDGYISDLTRTFVVGEVEPEWRRVAEIVLQANAAACAAGGPGVSCSEVDRAARRVIEESGYGSYFTHRTGHGIGMEAHEEPYLHAGNSQRLAPGMAYTVEPGIYLPGRGGVRIEDDVVVTSSGVEVLSDLPRALRAIG